MADKRSHFGMAGHLWAMSEFLLRGWNVSVPYVDVGDDVLVIEDASATIYRVQVKTREGVPTDDRGEPTLCLGYLISREQLFTRKDRELFYMLLARWEERWRFLLFPRAELAQVRRDFEASDRRGRPGRPPAMDGDVLNLVVEWRASRASGWGADLSGFLDRWPVPLAPISDGPGSTKQGAPRSPGVETPPARDSGGDPPRDPSAGE